MLSETTAELLLGLPTDQLLALVGYDQDVQHNLMTPDSLEKCREQAYRMLEKAQFRICQSVEVRRFIDDPAYFRRGQIVCLIADILGCSGAATLAALVVQEGLQNFCDGDLTQGMK